MFANPPVGWGLFFQGTGYGIQSPVFSFELNNVSSRLITGLVSLRGVLGSVWVCVVCALWLWVWFEVVCGVRV